jgi:hypothetical protein
MNTYKNLILRPIGIALLVIFGGWEMSAYAAASQGFPLIMAMNIGKKNYDDPEYLAALSRPKVVILGFYPGWRGKDGRMSMRNVVQAIKQRNPGSLIGQYTILSETQDSLDRTSADTDKGKKLDREGWWLLDANGKRVQWTEKYGAFETNVAQWTKPDENGLRYSEWLARRDHSIYFNPVPEFDIWFFDNALSRPAVKMADWDGDGKDDSRDDLRIAAGYRRGHATHWEAARLLYPKALHIGNAEDVSSPEYSGKLQGVFMEAVIGASWSTERRSGWEAMLERYRSAMKHTAAPHIVGFNVHGEKGDYQRMRYGLTSCLLDNGFFSYTDEKVGYSSVVWFDEYDVDLGLPIDPPSTRSWVNGVYRRNYQKGAVLLNPGVLPKTVVIEVGYRRMKGSQAPTVNDGAAVTSITLRGKDGIILVKE